MRGIKLLFLGLITFAGISAAALGINWYNRSEAVKKDIEAAIAKLNNENSKVTYESINVSGFPMEMNIAIVKPHFVGRVDKLLAGLDLEKSMQMSSIPQWDQDYQIDGSINISVNAFSTDFSIYTTGNLIDKHTLAGKTTTIVNQPISNNMCVLKVNNSTGMFGDMWNLYALRDRKDTFLQDFRFLDCASQGGKAINGDTKETLYSSSNVRLYITNEPQGKSTSARAYIQMRDAEATKAYDALYAEYIKAFFPNQRQVSPSIYGKQNVEIDLSYNGSTDFKDNDALNAPLDVRVNKFVISNAMYNTSANFAVTHNFSNDVRKADIIYKSDSEFAANSGSIIKEQISSMVDSILNSDSKEAQDMKRKLSAYSESDRNKLIEYVIPDMASLGKISSGLNLGFNVDSKFTSGQATLNELKFSATPYGINASGLVKRDAASPIPSGNLSINCNSCLKMIDDAFGYINRIAYVAAQLDQNKSPVSTIPPEVISGIKNFLVALSPTGENLKFDIVSSGMGEPTVNGKGMGEVMALFNQHIAPTVPKQ